MQQIGLTGLIGSGKTIVGRIFESLGVPVYNSDLRAKYLTEHNADLIAKIKMLFGYDIYDQHGKLNRKLVGEYIFNNKTLLEKMNAIVHPAVGKDYQNWANHQSTAYVIKESAILLDVMAAQIIDKLIVVIADESIRIQRVMGRDQITEEQVRKRIQNQRKETELISRADYVINNNGHQFITKQVLKIHQELINFATSF